MDWKRNFKGEPYIDFNSIQDVRDWIKNRKFNGKRIKFVKTAKDGADIPIDEADDVMILNLASQLSKGKARIVQPVA